MKAYIAGDKIGDFGIIYLFTVSNENYVRRCKLKCHCGKVFEARLSHIKAGQKSCGCMAKRPPVNIKHGRSAHPAYGAWGGMMSRCHSKNNGSYSRYGGRGILVCDEWKSVSKFIEWAELNGFSKGLQIDRIDNNSGYYPDNCHFVTAKENSENRAGTNWWHTPKGIYPSLKEASNAYGKRIAKWFYDDENTKFYRVAKYK